MKKAAPIINRPTAVSLPSRLGWQVVAVLIWTFWLSCWAPLLTLAVWEFGLYQLHLSLISTNAFTHLQQMTAPYLPIIGLECAVLLIWAGKEYISHGGHQRRQPTPAVDLSELAGFGQLPEQGLAFWQAARSVTAEHDDHGRLRCARPQNMPLRGKPNRRALHAQSARQQTPHLSLVVSPTKVTSRYANAVNQTTFAATGND